MAYLHFELSDVLVAEARAAGISIEQITETAVRDALAGRGAQPVDLTDKVYERRQLEDADRYRVGYAVGERWASTVATVEELAEVAALRSVRWQDFSVDTNHHSLGELLLAEGEIESTVDGKAWLSRGPFAEGIIDSAVETVPAR